MLVIPNKAAESFVGQASPDAGDVQALSVGHELTGVLDGCAVSSSGGLNLAVAAGNTIHAGTPQAQAGGALSIAAGDATNPRFDLVVVSDAGVRSVIAGTPAPFTQTSAPTFPAYPATSAVLAAVSVPAGASSVSAANLLDKRVIVGSAPRGASFLVMGSNAALPNAKTLQSAAHMVGTLADRTGALAAANPGAYYTTTDDIQATYRSNGSGWAQISPGLNQPALFAAARNGVAIGTRRRFNFSTAFTVTDDGPNDEIDIDVTGGAGTGWDYLGGAGLAANANTIPSITIAARDIIKIVFRLAGYTTADNPALRFNGDASNVTTYHSRHIQFSNAATPALAGINFVSAAHIPLLSANTTQPATVEVTLGNRLGTNKNGPINAGAPTATAATNPVMSFGTCTYFNTTAQITSVVVVTHGGTANSMLAGTAIAIFGRNVT